MKKLIFLVFLLVTALVSAKTERISLSVGDNYEQEGKNITLLNLNKDDEKVILCINNDKVILSKDKERNFNEVNLDLRYIKDNKASIEIRTSCKNCVCDESCGNNACFEFIECVKDSDCDDDNLNTEDKCVNEECVYNVIEENGEEIIIDIRKEANGNNLFPVSIALAIIVIILTVLFLIKKRK